MNNLEQAQFWALEMGYHSAKRPIEMAVLKLWAVEHLLWKLYFDRHGMTYRNLPSLTRRDELEQDQHTHKRAYGQICNQCQRRKPITSHYWCKDNRQRNGIKTICKICDKKNRLKKQ